MIAKPARRRCMTALTDDVQAFRHYVRSERGLADNTLLAYTRDLERFALWADNGGLNDYLAPTLRDRAILETLYATGSRASEVVGLRLADLHLDGGFCKCFGKGSKQRLVPLGRIAVNALRTYMERQRPALVRTSPETPWLFVSRG